ncbi:site-specific integrase [Breoghania sp.]|uniref:tyrosine-type recombinase/integrase n=1 Tax=Breoghania sp. TaxID=2065378 RepID=UPI002AA7180A|nr:site-specific integrase [Breoghania sp.]
MELSDLEAAARRFTRECRDIKSLSSNTINAYEQDLTEFAVFFMAKEPGSEIDVTLVGDYIQWLRETRELKPATIRRRIACLKSFCRWLKEQRLAEQSPFDEKNIVVRIPKRLPRALPRSQVLCPLQTGSFGAGIFR